MLYSLVIKTTRKNDANRRKYASTSPLHWLTPSDLNTYCRFKAWNGIMLKSRPVIFSFARFYLKTKHLSRFTISELYSNFRKQLTMAQSLSVVKLVWILYHAKFEVFSSMGSQGNAPKPHICLISQSQSCTKIRQINRAWCKYYQWRSFSGHISMPKGMPSMCSKDSTNEPHIWPFLFNHNYPNMRKINRTTS